MKIRIVSMMLILALMIPMMTIAFASEMEPVEEPVVVEGEPVAEEPAVFYLDGEPLYDVVAQCIGGTYYVTLASMMPLLDASAVVEEDSGMATVTAEAVQVTEVAVPESEEGNAEGNAEESAEESAEETTEVVAIVEVLDTLTLTAQLGDEYVVANGRCLYVSGGVIQLEGGVAVPIRVLAEALKLTVGFDGDTGRVSLTGSGEVGYLEDGETYYSEESLYWLSRIIYSESGNQPMGGKIAVGNVVLNRVNNPSFPDTIYDVIFQKNQFSPVSNGTINKEPNESSVTAAKLVLDGAVVLENALFFNRAGINCYASRNRTYVATIGGHAFYK